MCSVDNQQSTKKQSTFLIKHPYKWKETLWNDIYLWRAVFHNTWITLYSAGVEQPVDQIAIRDYWAQFVFLLLWHVIFDSDNVTVWFVSCQCKSHLHLRSVFVRWWLCNMCTLFQFGGTSYLHHCCNQKSMYLSTLVEFAQLDFLSTLNPRCRISSFKSKLLYYHNKYMMPIPGWVIVWDAVTTLYIRGRIPTAYRLDTDVYYIQSDCRFFDQNYN